MQGRKFPNFRIWLKETNLAVDFDIKKAIFMTYYVCFMSWIHIMLSLEVPVIDVISQLFCSISLNLSVVRMIWIWGNGRLLDMATKKRAKPSLAQNKREMGQKEAWIMRWQNGPKPRVLSSSAKHRQLPDKIADTFAKLEPLRLPHPRCDDQTPGANAAF